MKVIVCGAGQVGTNIARHLATEHNDVIVIDQSPELVRRVTDTLDVQGLAGFASYPDVLERAGASDADMLIAVANADEVNMVACQVAHSLFNVPTKIARVRAQSYQKPIWADLFSRDHMPIDVIISPEIEVARAINNRLKAPGAVDMIPMADGLLQVIGVRLEDDCPIVDTPLRQLTTLFPDLHLIVITIIREGKVIVPEPEDQLLVGDEVYFVAEAEHVVRSLAAFGHEEPEAHRIVIIGGGNIGLFLAQEFEQTRSDLTTKVIEVERERATQIAEQLKETMVVNGDALDLEILEEVNIGQTDTIVAVTNDDEVNILSSLLAKRNGAKRAVTLVNKLSYEPLIASLGIDVVVNPRAITVSTILQHIRRGRIIAVHALREGAGEVIEAEALDTSAAVGKPLRDIRMDKGIIIGAVVRGEEVLLPRGDLEIKAKDRVVLFAAAQAVKEVEQLFAVGLEFF
ncbi:MAG: Trk system potassium transporter TrkA [Alphaproteobacteria bacterium]|jgi:trk system potassium uptake protein